MQFYRTATAAGIKPILGLELYVVADRFDKSRPRGEERTHLTLLAENETGWKNLMELSTAAFMEGPVVLAGDHKGFRKRGHLLSILDTRGAMVCRSAARCARPGTRRGSCTRWSSRI